MTAVTGADPAPTVAVLGAGVMGTGVAQALASSGHPVVLVDLSDEILDQARESIRQALRLARLQGASRPADPATIQARIHYTDDYQAVTQAQFVIENVPEVWHLKQEVYRRIDGRCRPECVFAANTSAIPVTRIAAATTRPDRVIGLHFMNPVPLTRMVEVVRGHHTSPATLAAAEALLRRMGMQWQVVGDSPGFATNRVLMPTINEASFLVFEQVATASEVDRLFRECFGHRMGPLETADLIGLDTVLQSLRVLHDAFADSKYRPCPLLVRMVDAGLHGRKSGEGFYRYPGA